MPEPDPDQHRFEREIKDTGPGLRFRLGATEAEIAIAKIKEIRGQHADTHLRLGSTAYADLQAWRRQYIKACNARSDALDQLSRSHGWPADADFGSVHYDWKPKRSTR